jgi:fructuronate reductase
MKRLSHATLDGLAASVARPHGLRSDGTQPDSPCIVHLGLGAFARAHLAAYTQESNAAAGEAWRIIGVSLQRPDMRDALVRQDGLYTLVKRAPEGPQAAIIDVVREVRVAPEMPGMITALLAEPSTQIVSLTITEKGYCHDPATGRLNLAHPDIMHDLAHLDEPRSAIGFIVAGLAARRLAGLPPYTVMTCDNLPSNGHLLRGLVLDFASRVAPALADWIGAHGAFPSTMVDRIVPATTDADIADTAKLIGLHDAAPVMAEPFRQWVVEDQFAGPRPSWERAGAQIVREVAPFEFMKLRLLNGAHSTLAYLGYLSGHETVAEASADENLASVLRRLWAEVIPTVPAPEGVDLHAYSEALLARFRNPAIRHRTWQIAMDGSQKLPQRLLGSMRDALAKGLPVETLCLGVAGWMRYVMGVDETDEPIVVKDPLATEFRAVMAKAGRNPAAIVEGLMGISQIFGADLPMVPTFRETVTRHLALMLERGVRTAIAELK